MINLFFFSSRRRHTRWNCDWSSDVCSSDLSCERTVKADVVAFDQPFFYNRLGAVNPAGMIYALRRDVQPKSGTTLSPGNRSEERRVGKECRSRSARFE